MGEISVISEDVFAERRSFSETRHANLRAAVHDLLRPDEQRVLGDHTCIYVTGSCARGEMSESSDIDAFVVRTGRPNSLDEVVIQSALVRAFRSLALPDPSKDGLFLKMHAARDLVEKMGTPADDYENTFTARMLLLLESRHLLGNSYTPLIDLVLDKYWIHEDEHRQNYIPMLLINDVVHYWRVLLLNYHSRLSPNDSGTARRLANYKLRLSRCLTCYSALAELLAVYRTQRTVSRADARAMIARTPLSRLDEIIRLDDSQRSKNMISRLKELYCAFLERTAGPKTAIRLKYEDAAFARRCSEDSREFVETVFELLEYLGTGAGRPMYRLMVV